jgi:hypothetical protein
MRYIECKTQAEADAAAAAGDVIVWRAGLLRLYGSSRAELYGSSSAELFGSSHAYLRDSSSAELFGSSSAVLRGSSSAVLRDSSRAELSGSSSATDGKTGAPLARARPRVVIGPLGSRNDTLGVSLPADGSDPIVYAGCWSGTLTDFAARVESVYPSGRFGDEYRAAIAFVRAMHAIKEV